MRGEPGKADQGCVCRSHRQRNGLGLSCSYSQLLRLYKTYSLAFHGAGTQATTVMFSGYPGILEGTKGQEPTPSPLSTSGGSPRATCDGVCGRD